MDKILNFLKSNKIAQRAAILGGITAAAYYLLSNVESVVEEQSEQDIEVIIQETIKSAQKIVIQGSQLYDLDSVLKLQNILIDLAIPQFQQFSIENREKRRKAYYCDQEKYFELLFEYNDTVLSIICKQEEKLKKYEDYSLQCLSNAINTFISDSRYMQQFIYSVSKLKTSIPSTQSLSKEDAQQIVAHFIIFIQTQPKILQDLIKYLALKGNQNGIAYSSVRTALFDQLYFEKGIEEEDYLVPALQDDFLGDQITKKMQAEYQEVINVFIEANFKK